MEYDQGGTDHEAMRRLVLSRFEDDVLLRQEVEVWLDEVVAPGEQVVCECEGEAEKEGLEEESVAFEVIPGMKILAKFWKSRGG